MHNVAPKDKISKSIYADLNNKQNSAFNIKMLFNGFMSSAYASQSNSSAQDLLKQIKILTKRVSDIEALLDEKPELKASQRISEISGIVIDVRVSDFILSLDPKIRRSNGDILYPNEKNINEMIASGQIESLLLQRLNLQWNTLFWVTRLY